MADPARSLPSPDTEPQQSATSIPSPLASSSSPSNGAETHVRERRCPVAGCQGTLELDSHADDSTSGLYILLCPQCGHRWFQSREGLLLLFRSGGEYKFSYGPSVETLTVTLTSAAINLLSTHGVQEDRLAILAAEWTLLRGNRTKPVRLAIDSGDFTEFYLYLTRR